VEHADWWCGGRQQSGLFNRTWLDRWMSGVEGEVDTFLEYRTAQDESSFTLEFYLKPDEHL
jgi:hypothetical protein